MHKSNSFPALLMSFGLLNMTWLDWMHDRLSRISTPPDLEEPACGESGDMEADLRPRFNAATGSNPRELRRPVGEEGIDAGALLCASPAHASASSQQFCRHKSVIRLGIATAAEPGRTSPAEGHALQCGRMKPGQKGDMSGNTGSSTELQSHHHQVTEAPHELRRMRWMRGLLGTREEGQQSIRDGAPFGRCRLRRWAGR